MTTPSLNREQIRNLRRIGHQLKPIVMMGNAGLTDTLLSEVNRALHDHELIKIKLMGEDRHERKEILTSIASQTGAVVAQSVGKMALIYKKNPQANPKLSNMVRFG